MNKIILMICLICSIAPGQSKEIKDFTNIDIACKAFDLSLKGSWQGVIDFCDEVLAQRPLNPEAHFNKGRSLKKLKKHREAIEKLRDSTRDNLVQLVATEVLESLKIPDSQ